MRPNTLIATLALGGTLLAGAMGLAPAIAQTGTAPATAPATASAPELSLPQILDKLSAAGYSAVEKIERKRNRALYEVKAVDRDGRRVELYLDARSGEVVKREVKRDRSDRSDRSLDSRSK